MNNDLQINKDELIAIKRELESIKESSRKHYMDIEDRANNINMVIDEILKYGQATKNSVDRTYKGLSPREKDLIDCLVDYDVYLRFQDSSDQDIKVSFDYIEESMKIGRGTIKTYIGNLKKRGILDWEYLTPNERKFNISHFVYLGSFSYCSKNFSKYCDDIKLAIFEEARKQKKLAPVLTMKTLKDTYKINTIHLERIYKSFLEQGILIEENNPKGDLNERNTKTE